MKVSNMEQFTEQEKNVYLASPDLVATFPNAFAGGQSAIGLRGWFILHYPNEAPFRDKLAEDYLIKLRLKEIKSVVEEVVPESTTTAPTPAPLTLAPVKKGKKKEV